MKTGKISESVLKRTIIKEIKYKRKDIKKGAAVGNDGTVFAVGDMDMVTAVSSCCGEFLLSAKRAFAAAVNSVAAKGAVPTGVVVSLVMPEKTKESELRCVMVELNSLGTGINVQIAGGHTETTDKLDVPVVTVSAFGYTEVPWTENRDMVMPGMDIVMAGSTGIEGTAVIAAERGNELAERFTLGYINSARGFSEYMITVNEAAVAVRHGGKAMHDTSGSGVFGALWELGEYWKCGMNINLKAIPIRQETVELCEYFDMNPYFLCASGGLLIVAENGELMAEEIRKTGKNAAVIGQITEGHDKAIVNGDEKRFLEPPKAGKKEHSI